MNEATPTGHNRTLSPDELVLISNLKLDMGGFLLTYLGQVRQHVSRQRVNSRNLEGPAFKAELDRIDAAQPERWIALANTHFQQGLMALVRAVAQPEGF